MTISVAAPSGHGTADSWNLTNLHRTLAQVDREPRQAPDALARLLAQLATVETAGVVNPVTRDGDVRFEFSRFDSERPQAEPEPAAESRIPVGIG